MNVWVFLVLFVIFVLLSERFVSPDITRVGHKDCNFHLLIFVYLLKSLWIFVYVQHVPLPCDKPHCVVLNLTIFLEKSDY